MTALFLQSLHNRLLSQDAVMAELDFVHRAAPHTPPRLKWKRLARYWIQILNVLTLHGSRLSGTDEGLLFVLMLNSMLPSSGGMRKDLH